MPHCSNHHRKHILRSHDGLRDKSRIVIFIIIRALQWRSGPRFCGMVEQYGEGRCDTDGYQERVRSLKHIDGVNVIVIRVGTVINGSNGKQETIDLITLNSELC